MQTGLAIFGSARVTIDRVILQETGVDIGESSFMDDLYNKTWGFVTNPGRTKWTDSEHPRGGVAMLFNPNSSINAMDSWKEDHWTPHWMDVRIRIMGEILLGSKLTLRVRRQTRNLFRDASKSPSGLRWTNVNGW